MTRVKSLDDVPSIAAYLKRIGAEPRSLRTAVVTEAVGKYWKDLATITFDHNTGLVSCKDPSYSPTDGEAAKIKDEVGLYQWPELKKINRLIDLPDELSKADPESIFEFRDIDGMIIMLQQRKDIKGEKKYIPWTFWDDGEWRKMEPEGKLPLWGLDQLKDNTTVFIHEGAKAARAVRRMVEAQTDDQLQLLKNHPWGDELKGAAHIGWIGGALSPYRTDWSVLKRLGVTRAYIVSDNDAPGVQAVPNISYNLHCPTFHIQFTDDWPKSFDLADPFPAKMFKSINGKRYYNGPTFRSCVQPGTWATDSLPNPKGRPTIVLRDHFREMWAYVEEVDTFVCIEMPEIIREAKILNNMLKSFSHTSNTTALMVGSYRGRSTRFCYRPDIKGRVITDKTTAAINLHTPTQIKSNQGDVGPFIEFMEYLFPIDHEREEVMKWVATLVAKPEVRMHYALLLVSTIQGVGKTTLGERILAPLVGDQNVSFPREQDIVDSQFNGWLAQKRLIVVGEIYSGHSWKAYNRLKSLVTDRDIEVNPKFLRPYRIENWAHFVVCSNSRRALKMEDNDRRWYYPTVTEIPWPLEKFAEFYNWLQSGGLGIIKSWAEGYGKYVKQGANAPMSGLKKELIEASRSEAQNEVADLAQAMIDEKRPIAMAMKEIEAWVRTNIAGRVFDSDHELRKTMVEIGCMVVPKRVKVGGRLQYVVITKELHQSLLNVDEKAYTDGVREKLIKPSDIIQTSM